MKEPLNLMNVSTVRPDGMLSRRCDGTRSTSLTNAYGVTDERSSFFSASWHARSQQQDRLLRLLQLQLPGREINSVTDAVSTSRTRGGQYIGFYSRPRLPFYRRRANAVPEQ